MADILETITAGETKALEYVKTAQDAVLEYVKKGVEVAERYLPEERRELPFLAEVPAPTQLIDTQYAFAKKLLDNQRDFAKALVHAVSPLLPDELKAKKPVRKATPAAA